jgi:hypothetical protein
MARRMYNSLKRSGQSLYYEPSDWERAILAAEVTTRILSQDRVTSEGWRVIREYWGDLATTEAERRRAHMQVDRQQTSVESEGNVTAIDEYRKALGG